MIVHIEPYFHQGLKNQPKPNSNASNNEGRGLSEEKIKGAKVDYSCSRFPRESNSQ